METYNSTMKIAIASSGLGHVNRGIEAWADDLGVALFTGGHSVHLCKGAGSKNREYERVIPCLRRESKATRLLLRLLPRRVTWRFGLGSGYGIEQLSFAWGLMWLLRRHQVDVLHVQDPLVAIWMQRARRFHLIRTKTILAHGTEESADFLRHIEFLQQLAPWHLERLRLEGYSRPEWTAIPNFIDTDRFSPAGSSNIRAELGIPEKAIVVLTAAAIKRNHKRIDHLITEFARLRESRRELSVWLVIAGGWESETDELVAEGKRLLGDRVRFLVRFPRERMPDLYRIADVFVLCSLFEMMPIALIEATATSLPCVVHRHPILEWMTGSGGKAIDMSVPGELSSELGLLCSDDRMREELGSRARRHCLDHFSRDRVVEMIVNYYHDVVRSRKPQGRDVDFGAPG